MISTDAPRNNAMNHPERLVKLFHAFRDRNDEAFLRAAKGIISDEVAANHHTEAQALEKALFNGNELVKNGHRHLLTPLPKDRKHGDQLVSLETPPYTIEKPLLASDAMAQLERVILEHAAKAKLARHGYKPKAKLLFWGPPGCGKTMTARWLAQELQLPLGVVRLNALITSYLGETASHIQKVFDLAQSKPMVLLLDEADAIAKTRDERNDVGELKRVVNSLLQAFDRFQSSESVVIAASNHQYMLDPAIWRRFDDVIEFPLPNRAQIKSLVSRLLNGVQVTGGLEAVLQAAETLSFAQIEAVVVDSVKSMILADQTVLASTHLAHNFKRHKSFLRSAFKKVNGHKAKSWTDNFRHFYYGNLPFV